MIKSVDPCENCTFYFLKRFDEFVEKEGLVGLRNKKCGCCTDGKWPNYRKGVDRFSIGRARITASKHKPNE